MWRLLQSIMAERAVQAAQRSVERALGRLEQLSVALVVFHLASMMLGLALLFALTGLFFWLAHFDTLLRPAITTGVVALAVSFIVFLVGHRLLRR